MKYFFLLAKVALQLKAASLLPSCPHPPSNLINVWIISSQPQPAYSSQKRQSDRSTKVCKGSPEKALQGFMLVLQAGPWRISPYPRLLIKMFTQQKPGLRRKSYHSAPRKIKCSLDHELRRLLLGAEGRKGVPGKAIAKARTRSYAVMQVDVQPSVWETAKGLLWPEQRERDECKRSEPERWVRSLFCSRCVGFILEVSATLLYCVPSFHFNFSRCHCHS